MIIPDNITEPAISLKDQYFDLKGLEVYSSIKIPTLREYIRANALPCFKLKGKILIKKSEFDKWLEKYRFNKKRNLGSIVDELFEAVK